MSSTPKCSWPRLRRRSCKRFSATTRRSRNSIVPPARKAFIRNHSTVSLRTRLGRKSTIPAVASMPPASAKKISRDKLGAQVNSKHQLQTPVPRMRDQLSKLQPPEAHDLLLD